MGWLAESRTPWFKNFAIHRFIRKYKVDMSFALMENPSLYATFNDFFIRQLKPELRPIANHNTTLRALWMGPSRKLAK